MLTFDQIDSLSDPILDLYERYIQSVINDIARRLAGLDFATGTAAWQMQRLIESGRVYDNALKELSKLTGKSERELKKLFKAAGVRATTFDDAIYKAAGLKPLPLNLSPAMAQVLAVGLRKTGNVMRNLTMTTALSAQDLFVQAADLAYMQVSSGAFDYISAIRNAVKDVASKGLQTINYASGKRDQLDVAMRRTVLTGVSQTAGNLQLTRADEMGQDLVQVSAHIGARNVGEGPRNHESWQGKVYSRSSPDTEYPNFYTVTGYGTAEGLHGINCRHSFYPFFEGISQRMYSEAELESYERKMVIYRGKEMTVYEATQKQRYIERQIRKWKREAGALEAAGQDNTYERLKMGEWQAEMRRFVKDTGLIRQQEREQVEGVNLRALTKRTMQAITPPSSPVSAALQISSGDPAKVLRDTVQIIDSVHDDGALPQIPMHVSTTQQYYGAFKFVPNAVPGAREIEVSRNNPHMHLTSAHEIGHFLDHSGIGKSGVFGSVTDQQFQTWRDAIMASKAYQKWQQIRANGFFQAGNQLIPIDLRIVDYYLSFEEFWARSYAQFIAKKSLSHDMIDELIIMQKDPLPIQWQDDDFKDIHEAIEILFKGLGWLK